MLQGRGHAGEVDMRWGCDNSNEAGEEAEPDKDGDLQTCNNDCVGERTKHTNLDTPHELKVCETARRMRNITSPATSTESESSVENSEMPLARRFIPNPVVQCFAVVPNATLSPPLTSTPVGKVDSDRSLVQADLSPHFTSTPNPKVHFNARPFSGTTSNLMI